MRRMNIQVALLLSIALLITSPVALATDAPGDSATTVTTDAGYRNEDASGRASAKGDLNQDGAITQADALIALQMAARGDYSEDADVNGDSMVTSLDALLIQQTIRARCSIAVDEYTLDVADTIPIPIRVEDGVDVGSLDLTITFDPTLLSVKSTQDGEFDSTTIHPVADSGVIKVIAFQAANPGINGNFTVAEITFEALGVGESPIDIEIVTLTDSSPQVNHLCHLICNGTVTILPDIGVAHN